MQLPKYDLVVSYKNKEDEWQNKKIGSTFTKDGKLKFVITAFGKPVFGTMFEQKESPRVSQHTSSLYQSLGDNVDENLNENI